MRLLKQKGYKIQPFKVGPDYIDPSHHYRACGTPSYNLDTIMTTPRYTQALFKDAMRRKEFAIIEGVMGLFDGAFSKKDQGSTAEIAKLLDLPIILVFDARSVARSAAAIVQGFLSLDKNLRFLGVIANNVNSAKHEKFLEDAIEHYTSTKLLACLPYKSELEIPSRHLGLVQGIEGKSSTYQKWANQIENHFSLSSLRGTLPSKRKPNIKTSRVAPGRWKRHKRSLPFTVAIAKDKAFQFVYQDTLELFQHHGGKIVYFSPMKDKRLPSKADWLYFPGGYPELHTKILNKNHSMLEDIKRWNRDGKLIVAECGGLMYLGKSIKDTSGNHYKMAGIFRFSTTIKQKRLTLGYRKLSASKNIGIANKLKGHEFHYSKFEKNQEKPFWNQNFSGKQPNIKDGFINNNTFGFYTHIYWGENKAWLNFLLKIVEQKNN